jgi:hypothetical protein
MFTRATLALGVLGFSLLPLGLVLAIAEGATGEGVGLAVLGVVLLQAALWRATRRCASPEYPFWRSVEYVAACASTGWSALDLVFVPAAVALALVVASALAWSATPLPSFLRFLRFVYDHRLRP